MIVGETGIGTGHRRIGDVQQKYRAINDIVTIIMMQCDPF